MTHKKPRQTCEDRLILTSDVSLIDDLMCRVFDNLDANRILQLSSFEVYTKFSDKQSHIFSGQLDLMNQFERTFYFKASISQNAQEFQQSKVNIQITLKLREQTTT